MTIFDDELVPNTGRRVWQTEYIGKKYVIGICPVHILRDGLIYWRIYFYHLKDNFRTEILSFTLTTPPCEYNILEGIRARLLEIL